MSTSQLAYDQVRMFLEAEGRHYLESKNDRLLHLGYEVDAGHLHVWIALREKPSVLTVIVELPWNVPEDKRQAMAEAVVRANYGLLLGRFEFDVADGEMSFQAAMPISESGLTEEQFDHLITCSLLSVDRYHRAFNRLLYADDLSPAEVIAEVEMADPPQS